MIATYLDDASIALGAPDDPHGAQLQRGFPWLRFDAPLEREYRARVLFEQRQSAFACIVVTLIIWVMFAVLDIVRLNDLGQIPNLAWDGWLVVAARWTTMGLLLGHVFLLRQSDRAIPAATLACYLSLGLAVAVSGYVYTVHDQTAIEIVQIVVVMGAFLPFGLSFRQSLVAAIIVAAITVFSHQLAQAAKALDDDPSVPISIVVGVAIGALAGYFLEHAHRQQFLLRNMLRRQALFDPLTGLANRRLFEHHTARLLAQSARGSQRVMFAIIDIDFFKQYNDLYGHGAGDAALKRVAECLQDCARRPLDLAVRLGGEEFGLILHGADEAQCSGILETFRSAVGGLGVPHARSNVSDNLTVSIGAAMFDGSETLEVLRERADALLYVSKDLGRNRITLAWTADNDNLPDAWSVRATSA